jgi:hypothetical protein
MSGAVAYLSARTSPPAPAGADHPDEQLLRFAFCPILSCRHKSCLGPNCDCPTCQCPVCRVRERRSHRLLDPPFDRETGW